MIKRRTTRTVKIGDVLIGSGHPVAIQSMAKTDTADIAATVSQIKKLEEAGCEIVRVAVKDMRHASAISDIKKEISIPLVADVHFDHNLAVEALDRGADKVRINPGNIKRKEDIGRVIDRAREKGAPIRIGMNSGSLVDSATGRSLAPGAMVASMMEYLDLFAGREFADIVISMKSPDVISTVAAYRAIAKMTDCPLHVGITAAGLPQQSMVRSSIGIGALLVDGIGDTIRVSFTGDPVDEVYAAKDILSSLGLRSFGPEVIACPTCGRCSVDLVSIVRELEERIERDARYRVPDTGKRFVIAVMGCEVNGPGEAGNADIGIAFGAKKGAIFRQGEIVKTVEAEKAVDELLCLLNEIMNV